MKELTKSVENLLYTIAKSYDNIYDEKILNDFDKLCKAKESKKKTKIQIKRFEDIVKSLPDGIYNKPYNIKMIIKNSITEKSNDRLKYSPMYLEYSQFKPCKPINFRSGNIITGRDNEIQKILLTLCKKSKRGVILIGEAGVGKTSVVEEVNTQLMQGTVPRELIGCKMLKMDVPYILTKYKDDPVGAIINILEKASTYDKVILFIDEIHQLFGQRLNDVLKPYLTEKIRFIGSTTSNEYYSIVTDDPALERRFTLVKINEPNIKETISMVTNTRSVFESHHGCVIPEDVCKYTVENGSRFLGHRRNPDKSLDLLDISCTLFNNERIKRTEYLLDIHSDMLKNVEQNVESHKNMKDIVDDKVLTITHINKAISEITGIDYHDIKTSLDYKSVNDNLNNTVFNQEEAHSKLANIVNIFKHINYERERPISIILLIGKTGTGKHTSSNELAKNLFGKKDCLIDIDMSSMTSSHMISELKGAPPGYVGYGKGGGLVKKIRNSPQSVVYIRNLHHAEHSLINYLVSSCKKGMIVDSSEREASLINSVFVFSCTVTDDEYTKIIDTETKSQGMGFARTNEKENTDDNLTYNKKEIDNIIGKDIANIADEIVIFNELSEISLNEIYEHNVEKHLNMFDDVNIDTNKLKIDVLNNSKNGHHIMNKLSSLVPRMVFDKLKKK